MNSNKLALAVARSIAGAKSGDSPRKAVESPDTLQSIANARVVDLISEGEIEGFASGNDLMLRDIYLDETPIENSDGSRNFKNLKVEARFGTQSQSHIPGFPAVENELGMGVELRQDTPWVRSFSNLALSAIRIRLAVASLSKTNQENGDITGHAVSYAIDVATDGGSFSNVLTTQFNGKSSGVYERSHRINLPTASASGWTLRVRRLTPDDESAYIQDTTHVVSITEIIDGKFRYPNSALVGLQIDASQFQSIPTRAFRMKGRRIKVPSNYNPVTGVYTGVWDGTFKTAFSANPAWVFYDLSTHPRYGLGHLVSELVIDKWSLYAIGQYCDQMVPDGFGGQERRMECNLYLQKSEDAYRVLQDLASIFRGICYWSGGSIVPVADRPTDPVYTYTNANVEEGRFVYEGTGRRARHTAVIVSYNDMNDFGRLKSDYYDDPEGIARHGYHVTEIVALGSTSRGQAQRVAKWLLLSEKLLTNTVSFTVGIDGTYALPGQIVRVADKHRAGRRIGGRLRAATASTATVDAMPAPVPVAGDTLTVILPTGVAETRTISSVVNETINVSAPFSAVPVAESVWAVESTSLATQLFRVLAVTKGEKGTHAITGVQHNQSLFDAVDLGEPIEIPNTSVIDSKNQARPAYVNVTSVERAGQILTSSMLTATWPATQGAVKFRIQWRKDGGQWSAMEEVAGLAADFPNAFPGTYEAKVSAVNPFGVVSIPQYSAPFTLGDQSTLPTVIQDLVDEAALTDQELLEIHQDLLLNEQAIADEAIARAQEDANVQAAAAQDATDKANQVAQDAAAALATTNDNVQAIDSRVTNNEDEISLVQEEISILSSSMSGAPFEKTGRWVETYPVSASLIRPLLFWDGTPIPETQDAANSTFVFTAVTQNTILQNRTIAEVRFTGTQWEITELVRESTEPNSPEFLLVEGVPSIKTNHPLVYQVRVLGEDTKRAGGEGTIAREESRLNSVAIDQTNTQVGIVEGELLAVGQRTQVLEVTIADPATGLDARATQVALNSVEIRVSENEDSITLQSQQIEAANLELAGKASVDSLNATNLRIDQTEDELTVLGSRTATIEARLPDDGGNAAAASALDSTVVRVTQNELDIEAHSTQLAQVSAELENKVESDAYNLLESRVSVNEGTLEANSLAVTQVKSSMVGGGNLIPNATFSSGYEGMGLSGNAAGVIRAVNLAGDQWRIGGLNNIGTHISGPSVSGQIADFTMSGNYLFPVKPNKKYIASIYMGAHRSSVGFFIRFVDRLGANVGTYGSAARTGWSGDGLMSDDKRVSLLTTAPPTAVAGYLILRHYFTGGDSPYGWFTAPMVEEVGDGKNEPSPWAAGGAESAVATEIMRTDINTATGIAMAVHGVVLNVNGYISGTRSENDGTTSSFSILADVFSIVDASGDGSSQYIDGRWIDQSGGYMHVHGRPFGVGGEFMDWYGPAQGNIANCSRANAIMYKTINGLMYTSGSIISGALSNGGHTTTLAATTYSTGAFGTNGGPIQVNASFAFNRRADSSPGGTWTAGGGSTNCTIELWRKIGAGAFQLVGSTTDTGILNITSDPDPSIPDTAIWSNNASISYTDNVGGTSDRTYEVRLIANNLQSVTHSGGGVIPAPVDSKQLGVTTAE